MTQTIIMAFAAVQFVAMACMVTSHGVVATVFYQIVPILLALTLAIMAFGRFMGWPV